MFDTVASERLSKKKKKERANDTTDIWLTRVSIYIYAHSGAYLSLVVVHLTGHLENKL